MTEFWNVVSRVEGLWSSPLRVEVLRIVATTTFFILGVAAGRLWGMWRRLSSEDGRTRRISGCGHDEKIILDPLRVATRFCASGLAGATPWRRSSPTRQHTMHFSRERVKR